MNVEWGIQKTKYEVLGTRFEVQVTRLCNLILFVFIYYQKKNGSLSAVGTLFFDFSKGTEMRRFQHDKPK